MQNSHIKQDKTNPNNQTSGTYIPKYFFGNKICPLKLWKKNAKLKTIKKAIS